MAKGKAAVVAPPPAPRWWQPPADKLLGAGFRLGWPFDGTAWVVYYPGQGDYGTGGYHVYVHLLKSGAVFLFNNKPAQVLVGEKFYFNNGPEFTEKIILYGWKRPTPPPAPAP